MLSSDCSIYFPFDYVVCDFARTAIFTNYSCSIFLVNHMTLSFLLDPPTCRLVTIVHGGSSLKQFHTRHCAHFVRVVVVQIHCTGGSLMCLFVCRCLCRAACRRLKLNMILYVAQSSTHLTHDTLFVDH